MNFKNSSITLIKGDASFRKFYRKKTNKKSSIIVYAKKEKKKIYLIMIQLTKFCLKIRLLHPSLFQKIITKILLKLVILEKKQYSI